MSFKPILRISLLCAGLAATVLPSAAQENQSGCATTVPPAGSSEAPPSGGPSLTEKLDNCNGVLQPPSVGDGDMVEPAPQAGDTPVITPEQLPPGANPSNQPQ